MRIGRGMTGREECIITGYPCSRLKASRSKISHENRHPAEDIFARAGQCIRLVDVVVRRFMKIPRSGILAPQVGRNS